MIVRIAIALALSLVAACSTALTLTDEGRTVHEVSQADVPDGCRLMSNVVIGMPPDGARPRTDADLVILMRNKAGELGGSHVVIEFREQRGSGDGAYQVGRGTAYACPEGGTHAPDEGETAGGEEGGEEGGEGDGVVEPDPEI